MKLLRLLSFSFIFMWVMGQVFRASYLDNLLLSSFVTIGVAIYNNAHVIAWNKIKKIANKNI